MDETRLSSAAEGEWECDECGHIIPGRGNKPPTGKCPDCGEPAEDSFTFYPYDEDWEEEWEDELDDDYSGEDDPDDDI